MSKLIKIQRAVRLFQLRKKAKARLAKTYNLQRMLKGYRERIITIRKLKAIPVLQRILPMFIARYRFRRFRRGMIKI